MFIYLSPDVDRSDPERGQIPRCWKLKYLEGPVSKDDMCSICLQNYFPTGDLVLALSCGHYFHPGCIWNYLCSNGDLLAVRLQSPGDCNLTANGGDATTMTAIQRCQYKYYPTVPNGGDANINDDCNPIPTAVGYSVGQCTTDSTKLKSCPLCRALPAVVGKNQSCPAGAVGESIVGIGSGGGGAPDPRNTGPILLGSGFLRSFRRTIHANRIASCKPKPCREEHPCGIGAPKFCNSCFPSCKICGWQSNRAITNDPGKNSCRSLCEFLWGLGPFWQAKDDPDSDMFCDTCFWIRNALLGHLELDRFERLDCNNFLRRLPIAWLKGVHYNRLAYGMHYRSECEKCGIMFSTYWVTWTEQWCSKCASAPKEPAAPPEQPIAIPVADADADPVGGNNTIVLNLPPASPGFLAPRPTPAAHAPPPDTSSTSSPGISGEVPNSKPAAEPKPGSKSEPKNPKARKPKPERVMLQTEETVGQNEVGSDKMRRLLTDIPR